MKAIYITPETMTIAIRCTDNLAQLPAGSFATTDEALSREMPNPEEEEQTLDRRNTIVWEDMEEEEEEY